MPKKDALSLVLSELKKMGSRIDKMEERFSKEEDPDPSPARRISRPAEAAEDAEIQRQLDAAAAKEPGKKGRRGKNRQPVEQLAPVVRGGKNKDGTGHWDRCACAQCTKG